MARADPTDTYLLGISLNVYTSSADVAAVAAVVVVVISLIATPTVLPFLPFIRMECQTDRQTDRQTQRKKERQKERREEKRGGFVKHICEHGMVDICEPKKNSFKNYHLEYKTYIESTSCPYTPEWFSNIVKMV